MDKFDELMQELRIGDKLRFTSRQKLITIAQRLMEEGYSINASFADIPEHIITITAIPMEGDYNDQT